MATLAEIRARFPGAYDDMSDAVLADALYSKHYSDMPRADFDAKIGFRPEQLSTSAASRQTPNGGVYDMAQTAGSALLQGADRVAQTLFPAYGAAKTAVGLVQNRDEIAEQITGSERTSYPDAPEFAPAYIRSTGGKLDDGFNAVNQSAVTSDPQAQLDILRKRIPGLETQTDPNGNLMLRAPGMQDWAYLNKPGLSARDIDEFGTQTLATLPLLGMWGRGASTLARAGTAAGAGAGASVTEDVLAGAAGSDQGIDPVKAGVSAGFGGVTAPGVPSAIASGVARTGQVAATPFRNAVDFARSAINPEAQAERTVANAFARDAVGDAAPTLTGQQAEALARTRMAAASPDQDMRLMDLGGERTRALARSAANISPEARETLGDVIAPRFATQSTRAINAIRDIAGTAGDATGVQRGIEQASRTVNDQLYTAAYRRGADGIGSPAIDQVLQAPVVQQAVREAADEFANKAAAGRVRTAMQGPNGQPTLEFLDIVARRLSDREGALRVQGNRDAAATVGELRRNLQDALDLAVPEFQLARGSAATFFGASDALDAGRRVALGQFGSADARDRVGERIATGRWTPAQIGQAISKMKPAERSLFREGYVSAWVERLSALGENRNAVALLDGSPKIRQELITVLGPNRARQLEAFLHVERMLDRVRGAMGNSTTTRQLVELGLATGAGATVAGMDPNNPVGWIVGILTHKGLRSAGNAIDQRAAQAVARLLVSDDPSVFQRGIRTVANSPSLMARIRAADEAFTGPVRAAASRALTPGTEGDATHPSPQESRTGQFATGAW